MHFNGFALSGDSKRSKGNYHTGFEHTGLYTANWDCTNATDLVNVPEGESKGLVYGSLWWVETVEGLEEAWASVPFHVIGSGDYVISHPAGDGDEGNLYGIVANLLEESLDILNDLIKSLLRVFNGFVIHFVDSNN